MLCQSCGRRIVSEEGTYEEFCFECELEYKAEMDYNDYIRERDLEDE